MQKQFALMSFIAVAMAGLASQSAFAYDGEINFNGEVVDTPCSIAPASQKITVPLGKVTKSTFTAAGTKSTPAKFSIDLLGCGATAKGAAITFTGTADATVKDDLRVGVGGVDGSYATGVAVELQDSAGTKIPLGTASGNYTLVPGDNSLKFQAAYVSTGPAVTVGQANATAQFTVAYK